MTLFDRLFKREAERALGHGGLPSDDGYWILYTIVLVKRIFTAERPYPVAAPTPISLSCAMSSTAWRDSRGQGGHARPDR